MKRSVEVRSESRCRRVRASPHDSYYLIRSYASLADRQQSQDAFYSSDEWRKGPRESVVGRIDSMTSVVLELDDAAVDGLRSG